MWQLSNELKGALCIALMGAVGCVKSAPPLEENANAESTVTLQQATQLYSGMWLGEGFDPSSTASGGDGPTGFTCVDAFDVGVNNILQRRGRWFESHNKYDLETKLSASVGGKVPGEKIKADFELGLEELYLELGLDRHVIGAVVEIDTVERVLKFNPDGNRCDPGMEECSSAQHKCTEDEASRIDTADEFLTDCGDRYLSKERMGGYVLITADVSDLSAEFRAKYVASLGVGSATDQGSGSNLIDGDISALLNLGAEINNVQFYVQAIGIPLPNGTVGDARVPFDLNNWLTYMGTIEQDTKQAITNGHTYRHPAYGTVIDQEFQYYGITTLNECITGDDVLQQQFDCYTEFWTEVEDTVGTPQRDPFTQLDRAVTEARWKLDNPGRVRWGSTASDQAAFADALSAYDACQYELVPDAARVCVEARGTDIDSLCDQCVMPEECTYRALSARFNELPNAPILPPESYDTPDPNENEGPGWQPHTTFKVGNASQGEAERFETHHCTWTGFGGAFQGTGEGVRLIQAGSGYWRGDTWSQTSSLQQRLFMDITCAPRQNFFDEADHDWVDDTQVTYLALPTRPIDHILFGSSASVFALAGISGHMEGGGEYFKIEENLGEDASKIKGKTQQSDLRTWVNPFGLTKPSNDLPDYSIAKGVSTVSNVQRSEKKLEPVKGSFCYLSNVSGNFDGGAEKIWIEERDHNWWLVAEAGCEETYTFKPGCKTRKHVSAEARCYRYNQR